MANGNELAPEQPLAENTLPPEGLPPEGPLPEDETLEPATKMTHTVDEAPELLGKQVGEVIEMRVIGVSDDGKTYDLEFVPKGESAAAQQPTGPTGEEGVVQTMLS